jgi:hypothetical protein
MLQQVGIFCAPSVISSSEEKSLFSIQHSSPEMLLLVSFFLLSRLLGLGGRSATVIFSNLGTRFQPANSIELLDQYSTPSLPGCSLACMNNECCRTFDYDSACKQCRLFEGEVSTGSVVSSPSMTSTVGRIVLVPEHYTAYDQTSDQCQ